ncbi:DUF4239 domain-containing protein [Massilia sp. YIM B04103]|uniref:bestrophin-like domain n=1 Tax=Massilia sp. YIM B04103 TaxID=2963106 RepID=UPI00210CD1F7|nr:DUF4239 domain-containing protein [Massilia sp. YIM B04103]
MIHFLYNIPSSCMALIVVGLTILAAFLGYAATRRLHLIEVDAEQRAMALTMVSIITTINSLLVAFAAVSVWGAYNDAGQTVSSEAISASELAYDMAAFGSPSATAAGQELHAYLEQVVHKEWPRMQQELISDPGTNAQFNKLFAKVLQIEPVSLRQTTLLREIHQRINEMVKFRQQRLLTLEVAMPTTLWAVMLVVSALSFVLLYVMPPTPFYVALLCSWAVTLGMAFFFILAVDRPFAGEFSVSADAYQHVIDELVQGQIWTNTKPQ